MKLKSSLLSGLLILSSSIPGAVSSSSGSSTITSFESSSIYYDLKSDPNFDFTKYRLNTATPDDKAIKAITLVRENTDLYFYVFNENGKPLTTDLKAMQVSISTATDYSDTHYYNCLIIDKTEDNLFYKFKIPNITSTSNIYHIADLEFDYGKGYSEGRHNTIAKSWIFKDSNSKNPNKVKELDVVNLAINPSNYRFPTINGNGCYTNMFYITFKLSKNLGNLIGIKLQWKEDVLDKSWQNNAASPQFSWSKDDSYISDLITMEFTNKDLLDIKSLDTIGSSFDRFKFNFSSPFYWFTDQSTDYSNIPVIEKVNYDDKNSSSFDGYYFSDETKNLLNGQYWECIGSISDQYVIRFRLADVIDKPALGVSIGQKKKTEIIDCDVLTLTFCKDGVVYTLMASNKPVSYDPGLEMPENDLEKFINQIISKMEEIFGQFTDFFMILFAIIFVLFIIWLLKILFVPRSKR